MKKKPDSTAKAVTKIVLSVAILVLCFFRNRFLPQDNAALTTFGTVATVILIIVCLRLTLTAVGTLVGAKKHDNSPEKLPDQPIKLWGTEELFAYLEKEDIIDIILDLGNGGTLKIGTKSDYARPRYGGKAEYFDKCYYIEDNEYTDFSEFVAQFHQAHKDEVVKILYVGIEDMPVKI